jgi:hypothetical protein
VRNKRDVNLGSDTNQAFSASERPSSGTKPSGSRGGAGTFGEAAIVEQ